MNKGNVSIAAVVPEMCWATFLVIFAANWTSDDWSYFVFYSEIVMLTVIAMWSIYRRFRESFSEVFWLLLHMASTIGLIAIQNSSWTRFTVFIIMAAYIYGRNFREKQRESK